MARSRIGIWFVGAKGGVASTSIVGLTALQKGLTGPLGLVSMLPAFADIGLADWDQFVVAGHDIRPEPLYDETMKMFTQSRAIDEHIIQGCKAELDAIDQRLRPGTLFRVGETIESFATTELREVKESPRQAIARIQADLKEFVTAEKLDRLVMINTASTEPSAETVGLPKTWAELEPLLENASCPLPASCLYAIAALDLGYPYVNFTPSAGSAPEAIDDLAQQRGTCHMGHDGKTGETLLKSALAPMFAARNLEVMSWVGHNIFGNMDGKVLNDPKNKATKVTSKDKLLGQILGYNPQTLITIEYIASLGDWKTAWDHVHFRGFLGTPMTLQLTWQGCDSILAAPLVLDLVRFTERAQRAGETGLLTPLASFFKSPLGTKENDFVRQLQMLEAWVEKLR
jgi:myo-inositol-1-phosphate synthase